MKVTHVDIYVLVPFDSEPKNSMKMTERTLAFTPFTPFCIVTEPKRW